MFAMKTLTFNGGIYPPEMKELSRECKVTDVFPSTKLVTIPVTMGGAPNTPLVKTGDTVKRGQVIAKSDKFMAAPVHSSVSGKVKKIQNCLVTGSSLVPCIIIEADSTDIASMETDFMPPLDPFSCKKEEALARIRDAGIVGMGGASFPTHVKLTIAPEKHIVSHDCRFFRKQRLHLVEIIHILSLGSIHKNKYLAGWRTRS